LERNGPVRITKRVVDAAPPQRQVYRLWDADLKGFGLRISTGGAKAYFVAYRPDGGGRSVRQQEYTIGRHGELTPDQARGEARKLLSQVRLGADPQAERTRVRKDLTMSELCDLYLEEGVATKKASTISADRSRIRSHIRPLMGHRKVMSVTRADVEAFLRDIAEGRTAADRRASARALRAQGVGGERLKQSPVRRRRSDPAARGGKGTATRTLGLLGAMFTFAVRRGLRTDNPVHGVERFKIRQLQRFLSSTELGRLSEALEAAHRDGVNAHGLNVIRLLVLTGARKGEIESLIWDEIDFDWNCLRLKDSKTGQRIVPLGAAAIEVLHLIPKTPGSPYLFPGDNDPLTRYVGTPRIWGKVRTAAGLPDVRLHDLRHTYASFGVASGLSLPMIGAILGHRDVKTTQQYAHLADHPVKAAADRTAAGIAAAMVCSVKPETAQSFEPRSLFAGMGA
jgi:integrase